MAITTTPYVKKKIGDPGYDPSVDGPDAPAAAPSANTGDLFGGLSTSPLGSTVFKTVGGMLNGSSTDAAVQQNNEALATAAKNMRTANAGAAAPSIGQGGANAAQAGVDQNLMSALSTNQLQNEQIKQAGMQQGVVDANALIGAGQTQQTLNANALQTAKTNFASYMASHLNADASDPTAMQYAATMYQNEYGVAPDTTSQTFKDYANTQINAAKDPNINNPFDAAAHAINSSTTLSDTEKADLSAIMKNSQTAGYTFSVDPKTGQVVANYTGQTTTGGQPGTSATTAITWAPSLKNNAHGQKIFAGPAPAQGSYITLNGKTYQVQGPYFDAASGSQSLPLLDTSNNSTVNYNSQTGLK